MIKELWKKRKRYTLYWFSIVLFIVSGLPAWLFVLAQIGDWAFLIIPVGGALYMLGHGLWFIAKDLRRNWVRRNDT